MPQMPVKRDDKTKLLPVSNRRAILDLTTGEATKIGDSGIDIEGLTIDADNNLYGTTGLNGQENPNSLLQINKQNGDTTLISKLDKTDYESVACPSIVDKSAS